MGFFKNLFKGKKKVEDNLPEPINGANLSEKVNKGNEFRKGLATDIRPISKTKQIQNAVDRINELQDEYYEFNNINRYAEVLSAIKTFYKEDKDEKLYGSGLNDTIEKFIDKFSEDTFMIHRDIIAAFENLADKNTENLNLDSEYEIINAVLNEKIRSKTGKKYDSVRDEIEEMLNKSGYGELFSEGNNVYARKWESLPLMGITKEDICQLIVGAKIDDYFKKAKQLDNLAERTGIELALLRSLNPEGELSEELKNEGFTSVEDFKRGKIEQLLNNIGGDLSYHFGNTGIGEFYINCVKEYFDPEKNIPISSEDIGSILERVEAHGQANINASVWTEKCAADAIKKLREGYNEYIGRDNKTNSYILDVKKEHRTVERKTYLKPELDDRFLPNANSKFKNILNREEYSESKKKVEWMHIIEAVEPGREKKTEKEPER